MNTYRQCIESARTARLANEPADRDWWLNEAMIARFIYLHGHELPPRPSMVGWEHAPD